MSQELQNAIDRNDLIRIKEMLRKDPNLINTPLDHPGVLAVALDLWACTGFVGSVPFFSPATFARLNNRPEIHEFLIAAGGVEYPYLEVEQKIR